MSWFPTFLSPFNALVAAAVLLPPLVALYFLKLRRNVLPIASTLLWKKAVRDLQANAPFQRLRKNLLLLLQLLLLAALLAALAEPVVFVTPGAGQSNVILIDRSASMQANDVPEGTRLDQAKRGARELVDTMRRGDVGLVIAFDDRAEILQTWTSDVPALVRAIDSIQPTDRKSRLKQAYQLAEAQSATFDEAQLRSTAARPEVWVYSDGRVRDADELTVRANVRFVPIGRAESENIGIVALSARRNYDRPNEVQVFARLANFGPRPVNSRVELRVAPLEAGTNDATLFETRGSATVDLPPQRWQDSAWVAAHPGEKDETFIVREGVEFTLDLTSAAVVQVIRRGEPDALRPDDSAQVIVPPPKPLSVLLVTEGNYFLERLLESLNLNQARVIRPRDYESAPPAGFDVAIFDRGYAPKAVPADGNFISFGAVPPGLKLQAQQRDGKTLHTGGNDVLDWQRDHAILRGLSLNRLRVAESVRLDVPLEAQVLVEGLKGPLVVLHRQGRATHLVVAFDLLDSNWPTGRVSFPVFMYQALQFLALGSDISARPGYEPGATPRVQMAQETSSEFQADRTVRLSGPGMDRRIAVPASGDFALPALERVGVYQLDPPPARMERIAVNLLDENESNLIPAAEAPGRIGELLAGQATRTRLDLWWWILLCAGLPLLLIEWWVYTRRVHL